MLLDVGDLSRATGNEKEFAGSESRLEIELRGDRFVFRDVQVQGWAKNVGGKIYIKGNIDTNADLNCSCCLTPFTISVASSFEETYYATASVKEGDLDDTGRIYSGEQIDLRDVIIESLVLALPMKPVCHPDCKGLCPSCGCNLNKDRCGCSPQEPDPRLAALGEILKNMND